MRVSEIIKNDDAEEATGDGIEPREIIGSGLSLFTSEQAVPRPFCGYALMGYALSLYPEPERAGRDYYHQ